MFSLRKILLGIGTGYVLLRCNIFGLNLLGISLLQGVKIFRENLFALSMT